MTDPKKVRERVEQYISETVDYGGVDYHPPMPMHIADDIRYLLKVEEKTRLYRSEVKRWPAGPDACDYGRALDTALKGESES